MSEPERGLTTVEAEHAIIHERPQAVVDRAQERATVLMDIVEKRKLYTMIGNKKYLEAEAWQTIVAFDNACPVTEWTREMKDDQGNTIGYLAHVNITKNGEVISSGEMSCGFDEFPCQGRQGLARHRAAMSAAQTWAGAKAARMRYAWVAVLAGYEPTPAAEMPASEDTGSEYWCAEHKAVWFKKGKMRNYAHPIGDTGQWCNKPSAAEEEESATPEPVKSTTTTTDAPKGALDADTFWKWANGLKPAVTAKDVTAWLGEPAFAWVANGHTWADAQAQVLKMRGG